MNFLESLDNDIHQVNHSTFSFPTTYLLDSDLSGG